MHALIRSFLHILFITKGFALMFTLFAKCPSCKKVGSKVGNNTILQHVKDISKIGKGTYYYCHTCGCDVVYYSKEEIFNTHMINKEIGFKDKSSHDATICFCYNYLKDEMLEPALEGKINIRMNNYGSRCDLRNPSGQCCLKDIKKIQKEYKNLQESIEKSNQLLGE